MTTALGVAGLSGFALAAGMSGMAMRGAMRGALHGPTSGPLVAGALVLGGTAALVSAAVTSGMRVEHLHRPADAHWETRAFM